MAKSTHHLELILNLNSRLFINALDAVTADQGKERISDHNNSLNWLAAHTVWSRNMMCMLLGKPAASDPYAGMFDNFKPLDPAVEYPGLDDSRSRWAEATTRLNEALAGVSEEHLASEGPLKNPTGDFSIAGTLAFLAQHESYDIGQIGFLKKYFTREGMKY